MEDFNDLLDGFQDGTEGLEQVLEPSAPEAPAEATAATPEQTEAQPEPTPEEASYGPLEGVEKFLEENVGIPGADLIDNVFMGDQKTPEEIAEERAGKRDEAAQTAAKVEEDLYSNPVNATATETVRAVAGGIAGVPEGLLNTAELAGDTLKTFAGLAGEGDNIFDFDTYQAADWDLGIKENKTAVGNFAREAVTLLVGMRGAAMVPGIGRLGSGGNMAQRCHR